MKMPNFLIIGAQKAGTSALYHYLKQHPQIYMSPVKEPHFFSYDGDKLDYQGPLKTTTPVITNVEKYSKLFEAAPQGAVIGEASPSYIYGPISAERIQHYIPKAKIIAVLRHPAERAYSNFVHAIRYGNEPIKDFAQALQEEEKRISEKWGFLWHYQRKGFYYEQLKRYFDKFDQEQIRVYLYEDLNSNPIKILKDIFKFLEIDETFTPDVSLRYNVSGIPKNKILRDLEIKLNPLKPVLRHLISDRLRIYIRSKTFNKPPSLAPEIRRQLIEVYREDILKLQALIQQDLSSWLK